MKHGGFSKHGTSDLGLFSQQGNGLLSFGTSGGLMGESTGKWCFFPGNESLLASTVDRIPNHIIGMPAVFFCTEKHDHIPCSEMQNKKIWNCRLPSEASGVTDL